MPPKDNAATKFGEKQRAEQRTARSNCCRVEWHSQNSKITSQALIRGKILLFFLMPRNEWRGCGRRDGGEHISTFKNRITMNELWESCYRLNRVTRLEEKAKSINTIFFLFPSSELIEPVEITTWSLKKKKNEAMRTCYKSFRMFLLNLMSLFNI